MSLADGLVGGLGSHVLAILLNPRFEYGALPLLGVALTILTKRLSLKAKWRRRWEEFGVGLDIFVLATIAPLIAVVHRLGDLSRLISTADPLVGGPQLNQLFKEILGYATVALIAGIWTLLFATYIQHCGWRKKGELHTIRGIFIPMIASSAVLALTTSKAIGMM